MNNNRSTSFLPVAEPDLGPLEEQLVLEAVRSGWVSSIGAFVTEFEEEFAAFCGAKHGVATSNGTTALHLLLAAAGIGEGDEVVVPSMTFVATAAAVRHAGATPVFADCDPVTGTLDPAAVGRAIGERTKAIIVVHLYGHPADIDPLLAIARSRGVFLFEDAAEAHGARYRGRVVGSLADAACFSFYGNKVITTGEGGMVVCDHPALLARLQFLRDHAMDTERRYWHPEVGFNYRLTNPQAALGVAQLRRFPEITASRQRVFDTYRAAADAAGLDLAFNPQHPWAQPIPWLVCAVLPRDAAPSRRDELMMQLRGLGVDTRPYFIPLHLLPPYERCRRYAADGSGELACTESLAARGFNLPSSGKISEADVHRVVGALSELLIEAGSAERA
jgi:perosamine synthetase